MITNGLYYNQNSGLTISTNNTERINLSTGGTTSFFSNNSGSTVIDVIGSQGNLFSINDDLSDVLLSVNNISGDTFLEVKASQPLALYFLSSSTTDTNVLSIDDSGNVHKLSFSGITTSSSFTGGTVSGATLFTGGLSAGTISAATYLNYPSTSLKWYAENSTNPAVAPIATGAGSIAIGSGTEAKSSDMFVFGYQAGAGLNSNTSGTTIIGYQAGFGDAASNNTNSILFGYQAGLGAQNIQNSTLLGYQAGFGASTANTSNFLGYGAGYYATNANYSNFLGYGAGNNTTGSSYSTLIGYQVGQGYTNNYIGSNNIIIGSNITLPNATNNAINIGGILFGTGAWSSLAGNPNSTAISTGKIGVNVVSPTNTLHVYSTSDPVKFQGLQSNSTNTRVITSDSTGVLSYRTDVLIFPWNTVGGTLAMSASTGYIATASSVVNFTLPTVASVGSIVEVGGYGSGGWSISYTTNQKIYFGNIITTTTSGTLYSTAQGDSVKLLCVLANTDFLVLSAVGNLGYT